jgi:serine/threonine-protein phosphatase 2A regulatory subunit B''
MPTVPATGGADVVAETVLQRVKEEFEKVEGGKVLKNQVGPIVKALGLPLYWKCPFFNFTGGDKMGHVTLQAGLAAWKKLVSNCHDESSRFLRLVAKPGRQFVEFDDFLPLIQDVVDTHPGLTFLQDAPEFHSRYVQTVISRIFYTVNRSWSSRITLPEIRKSNFLETVRRLEVEDDINQITDYFSYEHFYVIYCKFWELDKDHDLLISKEDLSRHNDHAISSRIIDRIFSGAVTRNLVDGKLCYKDFVWFLMSEGINVIHEVLSIGFGVWISMVMVLSLCMRWNISTRSRWRRWRCWELRHFHSRIASVRCWTWFVQRKKVKSG